MNINRDDAIATMDRSTLFYLIRYNPEDAESIIERVHPWSKLPDGVKSINGIFSPEDYTFGLRHWVWIGREYSRVIYFEVVKSYLVPDFNYNELGERLQKIGQSMGADEIDLVENSDSRYKFRFWWD